MSGPNPSELWKSQNEENPITCSQIKENTQLAKFVAQNHIGLLKPKRRVTEKEKATKDNFENIYYIYYPNSNFLRNGKNN